MTKPQIIDVEHEGCSFLTGDSGTSLEEEFSPGWKSVHVGTENDGLSLDGLSPWKLKWQSVGDLPIVVPHPSYLHERHRVWEYEIESSGKSVRFAAGELSNGVWGFYVRVYLA